MKTEAEIQRAHDILTAIILKEVPNPCPAHEAQLAAALDGLCWVLNHHHNPAFATNLANIEKRLKDAGFRLGPEPPKVPWQKEE